MAGLFHHLGNKTVEFIVSSITCIAPLAVIVRSFLPSLLRQQRSLSRGFLLQAAFPAIFLAAIDACAKNGVVSPCVHNNHHPITGQSLACVPCPRGWRRAVAQAGESLGLCAPRSAVLRPCVQNCLVIFRRRVTLWKRATHVPGGEDRQKVIAPPSVACPAPEAWPSSAPPPGEPIKVKTGPCSPTEEINQDHVLLMRK